MPLPSTPTLLQLWQPEQTDKPEQTNSLPKTAQVMREASKCSFRLGLYQPALDVLHERGSNEKASIAKRLAAGTIAGSAAALFCNPVDIAKTRLQARCCHTRTRAARTRAQPSFHKTTGGGLATSGRP